MHIQDRAYSKCFILDFFEAWLCCCFSVRGLLLFSELLCVCCCISTSKPSCLIRYVYILTYSLFIELSISIAHKHKHTQCCQGEPILNPVRQWLMLICNRNEVVCSYNLYSSLHLHYVCLRVTVSYSLPTHCDLWCFHFCNIMWNQKLTAIPCNFNDLLHTFYILNEWLW